MANFWIQFLRKTGLVPSKTPKLRNVQIWQYSFLQKQKLTIDIIIIAIQKDGRNQVQNALCLG